MSNNQIYKDFGIEEIVEEVSGIENPAKKMIAYARKLKEWREEHVKN